jgi:glycosyltransferase involved in cell wall biosynthesis
MTAPKLYPNQDDRNARPHVTVIMPTFNRSQMMYETAQYILRQTLTDLELIISDDHSTDSTPDIAKQLMEQDKRVRYHRPETKGGINNVVNEGILLARGKYIQLCHDHDIYEPELSEKMAGIMDRHTSVVFVHPGRQGVDYLGNPLAEAYFVLNYPEVTPGKEWRRFMLSRLASPVTGLSMIRRTALEEVGLFEPDFGPNSDIDMWLRLCEIGDVGYVNELLLYVRGREPGHPYGGVNWDIYETLIQMHRKHLKIAYHGILYLYWKVRRETEMDFSLLVDYLNSFRHRRWSDVDLGRKYLRQKGILFSRLAAWIL